MDGYIGYEDLDNIFKQISEKFPEYTALGVSGNRTKSNYFYVKNYDNLGVSGESCGVLTDPLNSTTVENLYATDSYYEYLTWMRKWYQQDIFQKMQQPRPKAPIPFSIPVKQPAILI